MRKGNGYGPQTSAATIHFRRHTLSQYLRIQILSHLCQGKTLQVISLIIADPPAGTDYAARVRAVEENKRQLEELKKEKEAAAHDETFPGAVRVSVATGWFSQTFGWSMISVFP